MCQKCLINKINLECQIANLFAQVMAHNKSVSDAHKINCAILFYDQNDGDIVVLNSMNSTAINNSAEKIVSTFTDEYRLKIIGDLCQKQT